MNALVVVESNRTMTQGCQALEEAVALHGFGVLHVHDIGQALRKRGIPFDREVKVFDICNPERAREVLDRRIEMAALLPCSIAVFDDGQRCKFAYVPPSALLGLTGMVEIEPIAREVERAVSEIVATAAG